MDKKKNEHMTVKVEADTTELDEVIEKVQLLTEKLKEVNTLLKELTSGESLIEINIKL